MSTFIKSLILSYLLFFIIACSTPEENKEVKIPEKITILFVTQPSCSSCNQLEETMKLSKPKDFLDNYFTLKKVYLGEKLPDGLMTPNGTPTVYFLGAEDEVLVEPMIGEKTEQALLEFLEDALLEFKNTYNVDLVAKRKSQKPKVKIIAKIPEASGISFCAESKTLIVANDEGSFYELSLNGEILLEHKLGKYDLEGVVCEDDKLVFAIESGSILEVNRTSLKSKKLKLTGHDFKISKKHGIEGITKINDLYYLSIQAKKKKDAKLLVVRLTNNYAKVSKIIKHRIVDSAGLQHHNKKLYIVSDKKDKLYIYDLKKNKISKKIKLSKFAQEGVTFDNDGYVYFADDEGTVRKSLLKDIL